MEILLRTLLFASMKHTGQVRNGGKGIPFINHPIEVAHFVAMARGTLAAILAAFLHDVMEDCGVTAEEILELYHDAPTIGQHVLAIVQEHTDPPGITFQAAKEREIALMTADGYLPDTKMVILADQLSNMREFVRNPPKWGNGTEQTYITLMKRLIDAARGTSAVLETEFDCAYEAARTFYGMS